MVLESMGVVTCSYTLKPRISNKPRADRSRSSSSTSRWACISATRWCIPNMFADFSPSSTCACAYLSAQHGAHGDAHMRTPCFCASRLLSRVAHAITARVVVQTFSATALGIRGIITDLEESALLWHATAMLFVIIAQGLTSLARVRSTASPILDCCFSDGVVPIWLQLGSKPCFLGWDAVLSGRNRFEAPRVRWPRRRSTASSILDC